MVASWLMALPAFATDQEPPRDKVPSGLWPKLVPEGGVFTEAIKVSLQADGPSAVVRYTLDGTEPSAKSEVYGTALTVTTTTLIKARVFAASQAAGPTISQTYTLLDKDLERFTSNLPLVLINTFGREIEHASKIPASVRLIDTHEGRSSLLQPADFDGRSDVHVRGNSSLRYLKRSYGLSTRDDAGKARPVSLLGFPKESDWVLYAPYPDKSLLRDVLAYDLSRQMGHYASRTRFVEVFLNQVGGKLTRRHYLGVYVLEEKIKRDKNRVNVQKLGPDDNAEPNITGGYIFKKDHWDTYGEVSPTVDGRPTGFGPPSGSRSGYPTGPGGFPADPRGFLPPVGGARRSSSSRGPFRPMPGAESANPSVLERFKSIFGPNDPQPPVLAPPDGPFPRPPAPGQGQFTPDGKWVVLPPERTPGGGRQYQEFQDPTTGERIRVELPRFPQDGGLAQPRGPMWRGREFRANDQTFRTGRGSEFFYVEPKAGEITPAQQAWLRNHLNELEDALYGPDFRDPVKGYAAYLDVASFIDHHLMVEVTKNIDGFRFSTFFQKDRGGKIKIQPIWDWNLSFGNANGKQGWMPEYWYWPQLDDSQYSWFRRLFEDPDFGQRYVDRWGELRGTVLSLSNIVARMDALVVELGPASARNFERWPILGRTIWPNYYVGRTYQDEINYVKEFTQKRLAWIDQQFVTAPQVNRPSSAGATDHPIVLTSSLGRIYYTLDGTDPRAPGGAVSASAQPYSGPITLPQPGRLFARVFHENRWSPPTRL